MFLQSLPSAAECSGGQAKNRSNQAQVREMDSAKVLGDASWRVEEHAVEGPFRERRGIGEAVGPIDPGLGGDIGPRSIGKGGGTLDDNRTSA